MNPFSKRQILCDFSRCTRYFAEVAPWFAFVFIITCLANLTATFENVELAFIITCRLATSEAYYVHFSLCAKIEIDPNWSQYAVLRRGASRKLATVLQTSSMKMADENYFLLEWIYYIFSVKFSYVASVTPTVSTLLARLC